MCCIVVVEREKRERKKKGKRGCHFGAQLNINNKPYLICIARFSVDWN
jgi:hypothetical protein